MLAASLIAGGLLGGGFFGGLWWTVQRIDSAQHPVRLVLASFLGRTAIALAGFFLIAGGAGGRWERVVVAMVGFLVARIVLVRVFGLRLNRAPAAAQGVEAKARGTES